EYALHNPQTLLILSESTHSYIIGNVASYDGRQYPLVPPNSNRPEGQGFCHSLVIAKTRIYNIVDPDATANGCFLLEEMRAHFTNFWRHDDGASKIFARAKQVVDDRDEILRSGNGGSSPDYDDSVSRDVSLYFEDMKKKFVELEAKDLLMGFHVFPDNSIGHLHMHVFPHGESFRQYSTKMHDWKTVPLQAVLEVEREEGNGPIEPDS
ncbi:MAG: hypothetical protein Q9179_007823, partial [Wetmoreana sp. 5 TL-2023]